MSPALRKVESCQRVPIHGKGQTAGCIEAEALRLGATRCLRKPFRPATLLSVIDECLSEAEPHRRYVATLAAVTDAVSEKSTHGSREGVFAG